MTTRREHHEDPWWVTPALHVLYALPMAWQRLRRWWA